MARRTASYCVGWAEEHGKLAIEAANQLQPIWSQPRVKVRSSTTHSIRRKTACARSRAEIGFDARGIIGG